MKGTGKEKEGERRRKERGEEEGRKRTNKGIGSDQEEDKNEAKRGQEVTRKRTRSD